MPISEEIASGPNDIGMQLLNGQPAHRGDPRSRCLAPLHLDVLHSAEGCSPRVVDVHLPHQTPVAPSSWIVQLNHIAFVDRRIDSEEPCLGLDVCLDIGPGLVVGAGVMDDRYLFRTEGLKDVRTSHVPHSVPACGQPLAIHPRRSKAAVTANIAARDT